MAVLSTVTCLDRAKQNFWTLCCILFSMCVIITAVGSVLTASLDSSEVTFSTPLTTERVVGETPSEQGKFVTVRIPAGKILTFIMPAKLTDGLDNVGESTTTTNRRTLDLGQSIFFLRLQRVSAKIAASEARNETISNVRDLMTRTMGKNNSSVNRDSRLETLLTKAEKNAKLSRWYSTSSPSPVLVAATSTAATQTLEPTKHITTPQGVRSAADVTATVPIKQTPAATTLTTGPGNVTLDREALELFSRRKRDTRDTRNTASSFHSWSHFLIASRREIELVTSDLNRESRREGNTPLEYQRYKIPLGKRDDANKVSRNCLSDQFFFLNFVESTVYSFHSSESHYLSIVLPRPSKSVRIVNVAVAYNERVLFWIESDHHKVAPELYCALLDENFATLISEKQLVYTLPWHVDNFTIRYIEATSSVLLGMNFANTFLLLQITIPANLASFLDDIVENKDLGDELYNSDGSLLIFGRNLFSLKVAPGDSGKNEVSKKLRVRDIINLIDGYVVLALKESRRFSLLYLVNLNGTGNGMKLRSVGDGGIVEEYNTIFLSRVDRLQKHFSLALKDFADDNSTIATFSLYQMYKSIIAVPAEDVSLAERMIDETHAEEPSKLREVRRTVYTSAECHRQRMENANVISIIDDDQRNQDLSEQLTETPMNADLSSTTINRRKRQTDDFTRSSYARNLHLNRIPPYMIEKLARTFKTNSEQRMLFAEQANPFLRARNRKVTIEEGNAETRETSSKEGNREVNANQRHEETGETEKSSSDKTLLDKKINAELVQTNEEKLGSKGTAHVAPPLVKNAWVPHVRPTRIDNKDDARRIARVVIGLIFLVGGLFSIRCLSRGCKLCCSSLSDRISARRQRRALEAEKNALPNSRIDYPRQTRPPSPLLGKRDTPVMIQSRPVLVTDSPIGKPMDSSTSSTVKKGTESQPINNTVDKLIDKLAKNLKTTKNNTTTGSIVNASTSRPVPTTTWIRPSNSVSSQPITVTPFKRSFDRRLPPPIPDSRPTVVNGPGGSIRVTAEVHKLSS